MIISLFSKYFGADKSQEIAAELELNPSLSYVVLALSVKSDAIPEDLVANIEMILGNQALCSQDGRMVIVLHQVKADSTPDDLRKLNNVIARKISNHFGSKVTIGMGRLYSMPGGLQTSFQEAGQALMMGKRLFSDGSASYFGDLGVYKLLLSLKIEELKVFFHETIGLLAEYDTLHHGELLNTLRELLNHTTGTEAAKALHVHRNTLLYRMQRIQEITKLNLDNSETRLTLHLAFKAFEVIQAS